MLMHFPTEGRGSLIFDTPIPHLRLVVSHSWGLSQCQPAPHPVQANYAPVARESPGTNEPQVLSPEAQGVCEQGTSHIYPEGKRYVRTGYDDIVPGLIPHLKFYVI